MKTMTFVTSMCQYTNLEAPSNSDKILMEVHLENWKYILKYNSWSLPLPGFCPWVRKDHQVIIWWGPISTVKWVWQISELFFAIWYLPFVAHHTTGQNCQILSLVSTKFNLKPIIIRCALTFAGQDWYAMILLLML